MLDELKQEANRARTENGALTNRSSGSELLDLFATVGALRHAAAEEITARFVRAWAEDRDLAMKLLFYARDVRGGLGERRVFRVLLRYLAAHEPASLQKNLARVPEYGRWDDLLCLLDTPLRFDTVALVRRQLGEDLAALGKPDAPVSLLGKWLPSINAHDRETVRLGRELAAELGMTERAYRKTLTLLRARIRLLENSLRERDYSFDYERQPARALFKYRAALLRSDGARCRDYLNRVALGRARLHTGTLLPYELVEPLLSPDGYREGLGFLKPLTPDEALALNTAWAALEDFATDENALAVVDTSASMHWGEPPRPASVALSLGLYFAERAKGPYRNHFIEFSAHPELIELRGETFADRLRYIASFRKPANTNLSAVFELILSAAVRCGLPQAELPRRLYVISDMEFDAAVDGADRTVLESAAASYAAHGYELPQLVFWNVGSRRRQQPVTVNDHGVALVSGCSPRIFSMVTGGVLEPCGWMLAVLQSPRYAEITA